MKDIDVVVMAKNCYDQNMHRDFPDKKAYIATSQKIQNQGNLCFITRDICQAIQEEKQQDGKNIYLFRCGGFADNFIKKVMIDEYIIGIIPIILGTGRPLFFGNNPPI